MRLTEKQIKGNFERALKRAVEQGIYPSKGQGFDVETYNALLEVVKKKTDESVRKAKREFASQLDGTHLKEHEKFRRELIWGKDAVK